MGLGIHFIVPIIAVQSQTGIVSCDVVDLTVSLLTRD